MDYLPFFFVIVTLFLAGTFDTLYTPAADTPRLRQVVIFSVALVLLVALATFRAVGVGSDDASYVKIFSKIPSILDCPRPLCDYSYKDINVEFGFFGLLSLLHLFGDDKYTLFLTVALLSVYLNLKSIRYFSASFCASVMIYFCHFYIAKELNAIRVGLATAIAFYATRYFYEKRNGSFILLVILASCFHLSALLIFLPAIVVRLDPGRRVLAVASIVILVIASLFHLSQLITPLFQIGFVEYKLSLYSGTQIYNYAIPLLDPVNVRNLAITAFCLFAWEDLCKFDEKFKFAFYFFFSATFFRILLGDFAIVAGRGYSALSMFEYITIPMVFIYLFRNRIGYIMTFALSLLTLSLNLFVSTAWSGGVGYFG